MADLEIEQLAKSFHLGPSDPIVSHQISAEAINELNLAFFTNPVTPESLDRTRPPH